jgi:RNA exonuclease 4
LALDCEMVGVGTDGKRSILARASVVNEDGHVILDTFVLPTERVVDYRTAVSGVRPKDLLSANGAKSFQKVQAQLSELFNGRILVGHSLKNDMKVLMLDHPKKDTRDTSLYHPLTRPLRSDERCVPGAPRGRGCRALRDLVAQHLGLVIQKGEHSSVDDARAALLLYQKFQRKWENSLRGREKKSSK